MKSVIAIGTTAVHFGNFLESYPEYTLYSFDHTDAEFNIPVFSDIERYEEPLKGLKKYISKFGNI